MPGGFHFVFIINTNMNININIPNLYSNVWDGFLIGLYTCVNYDILDERNQVVDISRINDKPIRKP